MKSVQRTEHLKNKKTQLRITRILEPNSGYTQMEIEAAKQILFERESYELEGQRVRSSLTNKSRIQND